MLLGLNVSPDQSTWSQISSKDANEESGGGGLKLRADESPQLASPKHGPRLGNTRRGPVSSASSTAGVLTSSALPSCRRSGSEPVAGGGCERSMRDYRPGIGIVKTKLVSSAVDVTAILPPWAWAICETM